MSYPKAMLSQLTDLDDSELDEQAGVFNFSKKSAPPSPKVFFNPASVFLDVPDYRETVSHSKRFTHQPTSTTTSFTGNNNTPISNYSSTNLESMGKNEDLSSQSQVSKLLKANRTSSRNSERSMSVETFRHKKDSSATTDSKGKKYSKSRLPQAESQSKAEENSISTYSGAGTFATSLASKIIPQQESDSDFNDNSDEQEEYIYKMDPRRNSTNARQFQLSSNKSWMNEGMGKSRNKSEDIESNKNYTSKHQLARQNNFPQHSETQTEYLYPVSTNANDKKPDHMYAKSSRKSRLKFSSDQKEPGPPIPYEHYIYQSHRQTFSQDPNRAHRPPFSRRAYVDDWDSEDEILPLWNMSRGMREYRPRRTGIRAISFMPFLLMLTLVSFAFAIFSLSRLPLVEVTIAAISNVLASSSELAFVLQVRGSNLNIWTVSIQEVDLSIYATPILPPPDNSTIIGYNVTEPPASVYLGKIAKLQESLVFPGRGLWISKEPPITLTSLVRLKDPGNNALSGNSTEWPKILTGPYDLTVRGLLSYTLLFSSLEVPVCALQRVDPSKGVPTSFNDFLAISCPDDNVS